MNSKVIVLADETTGAVVNVSTNNPEYGYVRFQQTKATIDKNGFLSRKTISALMPGKVEDLQAMGYYAGQSLDAKIVIDESLEPFNKENPERDLKIAGETGIVCKQGDSPIYRRTRVSFNLSENDTIKAHDNVAELQAAWEAQKSKSKAMKPNEEFSIGG